jgi:5-methylcytosine-specific restriction protein A
MKNSRSFTKFIEYLGCHLKIGYHWSAMSADSKRLVVTIWDDQLDNDEYILIPDGSPSWIALPGGVELKKHVPIALSKGTEVIGVLCHAEDPNASRRVRAYYDEKSLLVLSLEKRGDKVVAVVVGEVTPEVAVNGLVARQTSQRKSATNDLDDVPEGAQAPERLKVEGFAYKRDRMVRNYVVRRANGKCEHCGSDGFLMANGRRYIEAHHIIGLGNNGPDTVANVIGLCPAHHREAHFGVNALELNKEMQAKIDSYQRLTVPGRSSESNG